MPVSKITVFALRMIVLIGALTVSLSMATAGDRPRAVLELFTSQGCSSCPAADKILAKYAATSDVLALSWHVDYWNYLGWKDTFSKAEFTERQRRYAAAFHSRNIYTPQAVINGRTHVVGSRGDDVKRKIADLAAPGKGLDVEINTAPDGDDMRVSLSGDVASAEGATLWMVYFDEKRTVKIKRGENRGRTITYHNVVRDTQMLGMLKGGALTVNLPMNVLKMSGHEACALILQKTGTDGVPGPILGATVIHNLKRN